MTDETLFAEALEKGTAAERAEFLAAACDTPEQRARLDTLLAAHDRAGGFLDQPAIASAAEAAVTRSSSDAEVTRTTDPDAPADDADATAFLAPPGRPGSLGRIGHYEVLEVLGQGGFGIVYRAFDDKLQRVVAVKVMAPHLAVTSPARKRFLREARSAAAVDHPNVVRVYAVEEQPLPFLVMEYIPGETLQGRLDRTGPVDAGECVRVGRQIAAGLAAAHEKGLIHRDIKPSNVLVDGGPAAAVKITDFGLARAADDASLTRSGAVAGTPMYMAPEQARGEALDHRADLFSLGSVLYQMASGRPPFRASSTLAVLKRVAEDAPRPIREIIPEVPDWYCRIVEKLHAKDPAERFQTAREVADLLADCETQLADGARLTNYSRIPQAKPATKPRPWSRRRVRVAGGLLALVSLVYIALWGGPFAQRYAANKGVVEIEPADGLMQVIVYGENGPVSDWYDARTSPQINLPPGQYTLVASVRPDKQIERWEINGRSFVWLGGMRITTPVANPTFAVKRGERVTISVTTRDAPPPAEGQSEKERLQGTWIAISLESQGKFLPVNPTGDLSLVIAGSQMRLTMRGNPAGGGAFTLDPSRTPKEIDVNEVDGKGRLLGIYRLEGDRLTLCLGDTGGPRPTMFETQPDLQSKRLNVVFRRATANEVGWVQLFNGKDLSGWKEFPAGRGSWTVENGLLVGKGRPSHLFTDRGDFTNFHLRMELRVRAGKNAGALGVFSRVPVEDPGVVLSTDEGMGFSKDRVLVPKLYGGADVPAAKYRPHPVVSWGGDLKGETVGLGMRVTPDEWMTCEFVLDAGQSSLFVKTERGTENTHSRYNSPPKAAGHLALQLFDDWSVMEIRKIEIKELPASAQQPGGSAPQSDADRLKGEWLVVSATSGGKTITPKAGDEPVLDFGPKEFGITTPADGHRVGGSYRLDPARGELALQDPRTGPLFLPIGYRFDGDRLRLTPPAGAFDDLIATDRIRSLNNLKQLALAAHNYHESTSTLPPVGLPAPTGDDLTPRLSWRVALLPYIEEDTLYRQFKLDESWDSEHNKRLIEKMPKVFATPGVKASPGHTHYRAFTGPGTALEPGRNPRQGPKFPVDFTDGSANTLLFVEADEPTVWTKPDDLPFDPMKPLPKLREVDGGGNVAFADGRGAALALPIKDDVLRELVTRNGGEVPRFTELPRNAGKDPVVLECVRKGAPVAPPEPPAPPRPADVDIPSDKLKRSP